MGDIAGSHFPECVGDDASLCLGLYFSEWWTNNAISCWKCMLHCGILSLVCFVIEWVYSLVCRFQWYLVEIEQFVGTIMNNGTKRSD